MRQKDGSKQQPILRHLNIRRYYKLIYTRHVVLGFLGSSYAQLAKQYFEPRVQITQHLQDKDHLKKKYTHEWIYIEHQFILLTALIAINVSTTFYTHVVV